MEPKEEEKKKNQVATSDFNLQRLQAYALLSSKRLRNITSDDNDINRLNCST